MQNRANAFQPRSQLVLVSALVGVVVLVANQLVGHVLLRGDRAGRVVAVATYLRDCRDDRDWSKRHTRFNGIRRFALRLSGVTWERVR